MKKAIFLFSSAALIWLSACNNGSEHEQHSPLEPLTRADSLYNDVLEAHNDAMALIGKLKGYRDKTLVTLDSLHGLPDAEKTKNAEYELTLKGLADSLVYADMAMDTWMSEFVPDSASGNEEQRTLYLEAEKIKATRMKEHVINAVEKAKSIFKQ